MWSEDDDEDEEVLIMLLFIEQHNVFLSDFTTAYKSNLTRPFFLVNLNANKYLTLLLRMVTIM